MPTSSRPVRFRPSRLRSSLVQRYVLLAGVGLWLTGLALIGTSEVALAAGNRCAAPGAASGQVNKNINTSEGCNVAGGSAGTTATGWISVGIPKSDTSGLVTIVDAFQAVGLSDKSLQNYVGSYSLTLSACTDSATSTVGTYEIGPYSGTDFYPTVPPHTGTLATITGTAGETVSCHYSITFTGSPPDVTFASGVNSIWVSFTGSFVTSQDYPHARSNSVKLFGTTPTPSPSPST